MIDIERFLQLSEHMRHEILGLSRLGPCRSLLETFIIEFIPIINNFKFAVS